jgi:hypothetical protein
LLHSECNPRTANKIFMFLFSKRTRKPARRLNEEIGIQLERE